MGHPPDQQRVKGLIREGLRQLRAGKVNAALGSWEAALALDDGHATALSYVEYIKKNRIRIAVHLGRSPLGDGEPIDIPEGWPEPPAGLCDPVPPDGENEEPADTDADANADAGIDAEKEERPAHLRPVTNSSELLPYAEIELTGASRPRLSNVLAKGKQQPPSPASPRGAAKAPPAPRPPAQATPDEEKPRHHTQARSPTQDDYLAMEIIVEDDEPPADPRTLPPPPEALTAPEMIIEAPKQDADLPAVEPGGPDADDRAPVLPQAPLVATTFDEVTTSPRSDPQSFSHSPPAGLSDLSPYTTLAGLGPRVLFAEFGDRDLQRGTPPLDFDPPAGEDPAPQSPTSQTRDDYKREPGSFSEEMEALLHPDQGLALARQLLNAGEHARSLQLAEQLQERYPTLNGISYLLEENRNALEGSLLARLGDLESIPVPKTADLGLDNQELDPRTAFLFSRIDGTLSLQDIIDISGMSQFESVRILLRLQELGLLDFEPPR